MDNCYRASFTGVRSDKPIDYSVQRFGVTAASTVQVHACLTYSLRLIFGLTLTFEASMLSRFKPVDGLKDDDI